MGLAEDGRQGRPESHTVGDVNDYYAMLQLYGGFQNVAEIVKKIPVLSPRDLNWACFLFKIKKEDTLCYKRAVRKNQD